MNKYELSNYIKTIMVDQSSQKPLDQTTRWKILTIDRRLRMSYLEKPVINWKAKSKI